MSSCYLHTNIESYSNCNLCGVELCEDCSTLFEEEVCHSCKEKEIKQNLLYLAMKIIGAIIIAYLAIDYLKINKSQLILKELIIIFSFPVAFTLVNINNVYMNISTNKLVQTWKNSYRKLLISASNDNSGSLISKLLGMSMIAMFFAAIFFIIFTIYGFYSLYLEIKKLIKNYNEIKSIKNLKNNENTVLLKNLKNEDLNNTLSSFLKLNNIESSITSNCKVKNHLDMHVKYLNVVVRWYAKTNFYTTNSTITHTKKERNVLLKDEFGIKTNAGGYYTDTTYDVNFQNTENMSEMEEYKSGVYKSIFFPEITPPNLISNIILKKNISFKNFSFEALKKEFDEYQNLYNEKISSISNFDFKESLEKEIIEKSKPTYTHSNFTCEYKLNNLKEDYTVEANLSLIEFVYNDNQNEPYYLIIDYTNNYYQIELPKLNKKVG